MSEIAASRADLDVSRMRSHRLVKLCLGFARVILGKIASEGDVLRSCRGSAAANRLVDRFRAATLRGGLSPLAQRSDTGCSTFDQDKAPGAGTRNTSLQKPSEFLMTATSWARRCRSPNALISGPLGKPNGRYSFGERGKKPGPAGPGIRKPMWRTAIQKGMSSSISFAVGADAAAAESVFPPPWGEPRSSPYPPRSSYPPTYSPPGESLRLSTKVNSLL